MAAARNIGPPRRLWCSVSHVLERPCGIAGPSPGGRPAAGARLGSRRALTGTSSCRSRTWWPGLRRASRGLPSVTPGLSGLSGRGCCGSFPGGSTRGGPPLPESHTISSFLRGGRSVLSVACGFALTGDGTLSCPHDTSCHAPMTLPSGRKNQGKNQERLSPMERSTSLWRRLCILPGFAEFRPGRA